MADPVRPFISIILPIRNEAKYIRRTMAAVLGQDYAPDRMEIIVVDGMSTDGTRAIIAEIQAQNRHRAVRLLDNPGRIAPRAMNLGMSSAQGEIIIRVDGHCEIAQDYVSACVRVLFEEGVDGVGGPIETIGEDGLSRVIALAMSSSFGVGGSAFRTIKDRAMLVDTVAFPAYTRAAIAKNGFYDEELVRNQDDEYNYRLRKNGGRILLSPQIRSIYYSRSSLLQLWRQYYQYGFWKVRVLQKHPFQMRPRQFAPGMLAGAFLVSVGLMFIPAARLPALVVPVVYGMANLAAAVGVAMREGRSNAGLSAGRSLLILPVIFLVLHLSYGLGFLVGLVRFAGRWGDSTGLAPGFSDN